MHRPTRRRRIAVIAPSRFPIAQPFAGGLQAHVWTVTKALRERGHAVTLFAPPGSDPALVSEVLDIDTAWLSDTARNDVSMSSDLVVGEHHAYLNLMLQLSGRRGAEFDVVHNHSLHYLPIAMAPAMGIPMVTTLHTPPTPWLESAIRCAPGGSSRFVAVSRHTARSWQHVVSAPVTAIPNGVDVRAWRVGPGGGPLVWSGRIAPEKGVHLAVAAAVLSGRAIDIAGPIVDRAYFNRFVLPLLDDRVRYVGHLDQASLCELVGRAEAALVTPDWDEPYGLVVAEALACATPVVAFDRGGIPEIVDASCARLVAPGDVSAMALAVDEASALDRRDARLRAEQHCSVDRMIDRYEALLEDVIVAAA